MMATKETPKSEPMRNWYVPWKAIGFVVIRARSAKEAVEQANEAFGIRELAEVEYETVESLVYDPRYGPGVEVTDEPTTAGGYWRCGDCPAEAPHSHLAEAVSSGTSE